jgi:hypothetical protein
MIVVSDDDSATWSCAATTIDTAGTDDGISVWRSRDQSEECIIVWLFVSKW